MVRSSSFPLLACPNLNYLHGLTSFLTMSLILGLCALSTSAQELLETQSSAQPPLSSADSTVPPDLDLVQSTEVPAVEIPSPPPETAQPATGDVTDVPQPTPTADELRQQLQIDPILNTSSPRFYFPGSGTGIPEGFGAQWGDVFLSITAASKDRVRTTFIDSGISMGLGLGNPRELVGLELSYNILSTRTQFAVNGSFDLQAHRYIFQSDNFTASAAFGWNNFYSYGPEASINPPTLYGVVSGYTFLRPDDPYRPMPLTVTLGAGGAPLYADSGVGFLAGAGVEVHPQLGLGTSWDGRGFGLGASYIPFRNFPFNITALYDDVFNMTEEGHRLVLSLNLSYNFR